MVRPTQSKNAKQKKFNGCKQKKVEQNTITLALPWMQILSWNVDQLKKKMGKGQTQKGSGFSLTPCQFSS